MTLSLGCTGHGSSGADLRGAHDFVQDFYGWYGIEANRLDAKDPAWSTVVRMRPTALDSLFLRVLREDIQERENGPEGVISGIDWDPFLNSQDPCGRYDAGVASQVGNRYLVNVLPVCGDGASAPILTAVLENWNGRWVIVTVRDSTGYDAVESIRQLQSRANK